MAMELPIVSTTIGAEGLPVSDGSELLLADTSEEFASSVVRVLTDVEFARSLAQRAAELVREKYGWDGVAAKFLALCEEARAGRALADSAARLGANQFEAAG
jgi:glycosyltransferase involved in cell wall biosynthesis